MANSPVILSGDISVSISVDTNPLLAAFIPTGLKTEPLAKLKPVGVSIRYGINTVPTAVLDLTPSALWLVCDIEAWRRVPVIVKITSTKGCTTFHGLIDGISINQSVGETRLQLVLKNYFQLLHEINPKLPGYNSNSIDFTKRISTLVREKGEGNLLDNNTFLKIVTGNNVQSISLALPVISGIIEIFKVMLSDVDQWALLTDQYGLHGGAAIEAAKAISTKQQPVARLLLHNIDTSFVPTYLKLGDFLALNFILEAITGSRGNLMDALLGVLDIIGCSLVIGNTKAFVIPNSGFLELTHEANIGLRAFSPEVNVVYPAQYNNLSFNDNGYRDIAGVYITSDERNQDSIDGFFLDPAGGTGGIVGETMPMVYCFTTATQLNHLKKEQTKALGDDQLPSTVKDNSTSGTTIKEEQDQLQQAKRSTQADVSESKQQELKSADLRQTVIDNRKQFVKDWAELRYYQLKYSDRLGSYSRVFNPNVAPGCVGSIYLREPGAFIDHFVTQVVHEIHLHAPSGGTAMTQVSFNCGRLGAIGTTLLRAGMKSFSLFDGFNAATSQAVAEAFIKDTL